MKCRPWCVRHVDDVCTSAPAEVGEVRLSHVDGDVPMISFYIDGDELGVDDAEVFARTILARVELARILDPSE